MCLRFQNNFLKNILDCHTILVNISRSKTILREVELLWAFPPLGMSSRAVCCGICLANRALAWLHICCRHSVQEPQSKALCGLTWKLCLHFHFWNATGYHETKPDSL
ncbi:hypothetical protein ATANTOWER_008327 [Ataeniobius toweri]|uniref:Uncharacterized protein n=2 Tax=Goodeidae TaxID=28758 RepID=A0ABU7A702_9TELE|nr:hypothetical protein [Ataeniobius toweri]